MNCTIVVEMIRAHDQRYPYRQWISGKWCRKFWP
jgi:hypothetical protein